MDYSSDRSNQHPSTDEEASEQNRGEEALGPAHPASTSPPVATGKIGLRVTHLPFDWNKVSRDGIDEMLSRWVGQATEFRVDDGKLNGCYYVNPTVEIYSPVPSGTVLNLAKQYSDTWCDHLGDAFGLGELKGERHTVPLVDRNLDSGGVMIIDGEIVHTSEWDKVQLRDERSVLCDAQW